MKQVHDGPVCYRARGGDQPCQHHTISCRGRSHINIISSDSDLIEDVVKIMIRTEDFTLAQLSIEQALPPIQQGSMSMV